MKALLLENIHSTAKSILEKKQIQTELLDQALDQAELIQKINQNQIQILGIRSKTTVSELVINSCPSLKIVGSFCIGVDKVDQRACNRQGVVMFNAPYSNGRSVAELTIGLIVDLLRKVQQKNLEMHQGIWHKSAKNCFELRGKTLGIIGYGNIGSQVSVLAEAMGLEVLYYDLQEKPAMGNSRQVQLDFLLQNSHIISLHIDARKENKDWFNADKMAKMKLGSYLINLARGQVVNLPDLKKFLTKKHILSAALDVYPEEPKSNGQVFTDSIKDFENVILTPHIGGATEEAQKSIAEFVPKQILEFLQKGDTSMSVNFPRINLPFLPENKRFIHLHQNLPGMLAKINQILAKHSINIEAQYLKTKEELGYVITDISGNLTLEAFEEIKTIPNTILAEVVGLNM